MMVNSKFIGILKLIKTKSCCVFVLTDLPVKTNKTKHTHEARGACCAAAPHC